MTVEVVDAPEARRYEARIDRHPAYADLLYQNRSSVSD